MTRAEAAGYRGIIVTLDTWVTGFRPRYLNAGNFPQLRGHVLKNYTADPVFQKLLGKDASESPAEAVALWGSLFGRPMLWEDIAWLRGLTQLPILLKGVMNPADARRAIALGIDGLVVSNHGGRVLDTLPAAIEALPAIAAEVKGAVPLLVDGGIRRGTDIVKSIAYGATAVMVGRPVLHALSAAGAPGVAHALHLLRAELEVAMTLVGCARLEDISPDVLFAS
ncbi:MAG: hypothetical protein B7Z45_06115 [Azorhizobium sp. 12-66-6]|nr:MAG: hypothetical protein B7Z45_06115 [Azorhizobium sp. 12-66-6]